MAGERAPAMPVSIAPAGLARAVVPTGSLRHGLKLEMEAVALA